MKSMNIEQNIKLSQILVAATAGAPPAPPHRPLPLPDQENFEFFDLVDELVELNRRNRTLPRADKRGAPPAAYIAWLGTVRAYVGRRGGSSSYIRRRATENDLVIVASNKIRDHDYTPYGMRCDVMTPDQLQRRQHGKRRYNTVYVDDPTFVFDQVRQDELTYILTHDTDQTFILLGI